MNATVQRLTLVLFLFVGAAMAAAQQAAAGETKASGRVIDANGKPVANATVTWLARPLQHWLDTGPEHRVVATTDDKGRFRIALQADTTYSAWANWADGATAIAEGASADEFVLLRGQRGTAPIEVAVTGLSAWSEHAGFSLRVVVGTENLDFVTGVRDGDVWRFPPLPRLSHRTYELLQADGSVLWASQGKPIDARWQLEVPPPEQYRVLVRDGTGQPLPGAEVLVHVINYWMTDSDGVLYADRFRCLWPRAGTTDASGELTFRSPRRSRQDGLYVLAMRAGHRMSFSGWNSAGLYSDGEVTTQPSAAEDVVPTLVLTLPVAQPVELAVPQSSAQSMAEGPVVVACRMHLRNGNGAMGLPVHLVLENTKGSVAFASPLPPRDEVEFSAAHVAAPLRRETAAAHGVGLPVHWLWRHQAGVPIGEQKQRAPTWRAVHVLAADGRPAARSVVLGMSAEREVRLYRADRLGRVLVDASVGTWLAVSGPDGAARCEVGPGNSTIELALVDCVPAAVRVTDAGGAPCGNATVRIDGLKVDGRDVGSAACNWLVQLAQPRAWITTDAKGEGVLLMPPWAGVYSVTGMGAAGHGETQFELDPAKPAAIDLVLTEPKR